MFVKVIVDISHQNINKEFDYSVDESLIDSIAVGKRVIVPFNNSTRIGLILEVLKESKDATKHVIYVIDQNPVMDKLAFELYHKLIENPLTLKAQALELVIPSNHWVKCHKEIKIINHELLTERIKALVKNANKITLSGKSYTDYAKELIKLADQGALVITNVAKYSTTDKQQYFISLIQEPPNVSDNQRALIDYLTSLTEPVKLADLQESYRLSSINTLVKKGYLKKEMRQVIRVDDEYVELIEVDQKLSKKQQLVWQQINTLQGYHKVLFKGVSASGKTRVILELIKKSLNQGQKVMILVPEIILLNPMYCQVMSFFPLIKSVIYHHDLPKGQKHDIYSMVEQSLVDVIISTRSGVFLPVRDLGLIVVDEAHDKSYLQSNHPLGVNKVVEYDTIELLSVIGKNQDIPLILSTATPTIKQMYEASNHTLVQLDEKVVYQGANDVKIIDLKKELKSGNKSIISHTLKTSIDEAMNNNQQSMLLINQTGYAPFVMCLACGNIPKDPTTHKTLTYFKQYHQMKEVLANAETNYVIPYTKECSVCYQPTMRPVSFGTEYVEEKVKALYPNKRVIRIDGQTTNNVEVAKKLWLEFLSNEANIIVGTQMIAKGLDFKNLKVVGIVMADQMLKTPTYLAAENTYNLLAQAAGRVGRHQPGLVILQTYEPANKIYHQALNGDYETYYKVELENRKIVSNPPFRNISTIMVSANNMFNAYRIASNIKAQLEDKNIRVLGPTEAVVPYLFNQYRVTLSLKYDQKQLPIIKEVLEKQKQNLKFFKYLESV